jgi:hypothetical protein
LSRTDKKAPVKQSSYLGALRAISAHPRFDVDNSVAALRDATCAFVNWLKQEVSVDVWLPSIDTQASIQISRLNFLKMCGDISKHNVLRSVGVAEELQQMLAAGGASVELEDAMLALGDFYERFHTDILNYHSSTIAEFLNNIRWGIYEYLQPEFRRSIVWEGGDDCSEPIKLDHFRAFLTEQTSPYRIVEATESRTRQASNSLTPSECVCADRRRPGNDPCVGRPRGSPRSHGA